MKKILTFLDKQPIVFTVILSVILNFFIECLARFSIFETVAFTIKNPFIFVYNTVIILFTLSVALYFSKRHSVYLLVSFLWVTLGVVNFILMLLRGTPLSAVDFVIFKTGITLVHLYISWPLLILLILLAVGAIAGIIAVFVKGKSLKPSYIKAVIVSLLCAFSITMTSQKILTSEEVVAANRDLAKTYEDFGFACCFSYSLFGQGIDQPENYSHEAIENIISTIDANTDKTPDKKPNIIYVQLESFFNPEYLDIPGLKFSAEPIPNFKAMMVHYPGGFLKVPAFGGGTANTEFEVLTQLNLKSFGLAEFPYTGALKERSVETPAFSLKPLGYTSHAMHNHTGTFYDRDIVYKNLGFDTFTPIEYMKDAERNPQGWSKDYILENEIMGALSSTPGKDFIFAVSVQGHGQYPSEFDGRLPIEVSGITDPEMKTNLEYYLWQINEMDDFIGRLTRTLSTHPEDTVVVFYGDHLPALKIGEENSKNIGQYPTTCDRFTTEYVIWSNFSLDGKDEDIPANRLTPRVMSLLGMDAGITTKVNQNPKLSDAQKNSYNKLIAYDLFYGERYITNTIDLTPPQMKLGYNEILIESVFVDAGSGYVSGKGFNRYSKVNIDGKEVDTEFVSAELLKFSADDLKKGDAVCVTQEAEIKTLGATNTLIY